MLIQHSAGLRGNVADTISPDLGRAEIWPLPKRKGFRCAPLASRAIAPAASFVEMIFFM